MRKPSIFRAFLLTVIAFLTFLPTPCTGSAGSCLEFEQRWPYGESEAVAFANGIVAYSAGSVLRFVQLDDPENPVQLGEVTLPQQAYDVELVPERSIALVSCKQSGLQVIDYTNPAEPVIASVLDSHGYTWTAVAKGTIAFVATSDTLLSVDFSDPTNLQLLDSPDPTIGAYDAVISGALLVVTTSDWDLAFFDISDPAAPTTISVAEHGGGMNLIVSGEFLFQTWENGIRFFDISDPSIPEYLGIGQSSLSPWFAGLAASGPFLFATAYDVGVQVFEKTEENEIVEIGLWESDARTRGITVVDGAAAVADGHRGLQILDVGEPTAPSVVSSIDGVGFTNRVVEKDGFFIGAESGYGLRVIDLDSPLAEQTVARLQLPSGGADLALMGDFAVVAAGSTGVHIVDLSSPLNPILVASVSMADKTYRVVLQPPSADIAAGNSGLRILDLSDPSAPQEIGHWTEYFFRATDVAATGSTVLLADPDGNISLAEIDVTDLTEPAAVSVRAGEYGRTVEAAGEQQFLCFYGPSVGPHLVQLDPEDTSNPSGLGILPLGASCWDLAIVGQRLLVPQVDSIMTCGFANDGVIPVFGQEPFPEYPWRLTYASGRLLATSTAGGFVVFNVGFFCDGFETGDTSTWSAATATK